MADNLLGGYMPSLGKSVERAMSLKYMKTRNMLAEKELEDFPMKRQERLYDLSMNHLKSVTDKDDYAGYYKYMQQFGAEHLPPPSEFQDQPDEYFQEWKRQQFAADEYVKDYFVAKSEDRKQANREKLEKLEHENRVKLEKLRHQLEMLTPKEGRAMKTWVKPDGEVVTLPNNVKPPEGSTPWTSSEEIEVTPEGGVRITRGKRQEEKTMPASEVGKIGEFKAYIDTMGEIETLIREGKGNVTGPFEFVAKRMDNWGIMPKEERIEMRALVARLPGLMYAMRGKQLSDKEIEVALNMMPQMNMDEKAFGIQLKKFSEYMTLVLSGKEKAFGGAGYQTGAFPETTKGSGMDAFWE